MFYPKKSLGQNFLIDPNIVKKIINLIEPEPMDKILEIGPGQGALTKYLFKKSTNIVGVEKDKDLAFFLKKQYPFLNLILMDALKLPWERVGGYFTKIVGNLPYNIASTLIWDIVSNIKQIELMVFTVQKEVAEKIGAKIGTKQYGILSVWIQTFCYVKEEFSIKPTCFYPRPKVTSKVLTLKPKEIFITNDLKKKLSATIKICFNTPRKQLGTILKNRWNNALEIFFKNEKIDKKMRPNMLSPDQYFKLAQIIF